jgi:hypothetical protein
VRAARSVAVRTASHVNTPTYTTKHKHTFELSYARAHCEQQGAPTSRRGVRDEREVGVDGVHTRWFAHSHLALNDSGAGIDVRLFTRQLVTARERHQSVRAGTGHLTGDLRGLRSYHRRDKKKTRHVT